MRLIQYDCRITRESGVVHGFSKKHTIGHILEKGGPRFRHVLKTDRISHFLPKWDWVRENVSNSTPNPLQRHVPSISSATRCATDIAATLRGCVQPTTFPRECGRPD